MKPIQKQCPFMSLVMTEGLFPPLLKYSSSITVHSCSIQQFRKGTKKIPGVAKLQSIWGGKISLSKLELGWETKVNTPLLKNGNDVFKSSQVFRALPGFAAHLLCLAALAPFSSMLRHWPHTDPEGQALFSAWTIICLWQTGFSLSVSSNYSVSLTLLSLSNGRE